LVDIVVRGRNVEVSDRFRVRVAEKLAKVERLDHKVRIVDVEISKDRTRGSRNARSGSS
jgi:ribosomal subunit interface protein